MAAMAEEFDFSSEDENEWKFDENGTFVEPANETINAIHMEAELPPVEISENGKGDKISRMELNTTKAGMEGLDRDKINQIIFEASKGSRFYENEKKKEKQVQKRIEELQHKMSQLSNEAKEKARLEMDKIVADLEKSRDLSRTIVHIDMDAFYAAVEMRDEPSLRSKPMAVGSSSMLCTSNYLARRYGVRAAMPGFIAKKLCPQLVIVPTNFTKYRKISEEIREIMACYDPNYLPMSLDEAYLDITEYLKRHLQEGNLGNLGSSHETSDVGDGEVVQINEVAQMPNNNTNDSETFQVSRHVQEVEKIVEGMRRRIEEKTQLTASAGIAPNMFLAKVCSDMNKPNGQYYLKPEREAIMDFVRKLPVRKAFGIGRVSEQIVTSVLKVNTCNEFLEKRDVMHLLFSPITCRSYLEIALGLGSTVIDVSRERKSMSTETTFREISKPEAMFAKCYELCSELSKSMKQEGILARKVGIKLKTVNFEVKTKISTSSKYIQETEDLFHHAKKLINNELKACLPQPLRLRLMGVRATELRHMKDTTQKQLNITDLLKHSGAQTEHSLESGKNNFGEGSSQCHYQLPSEGIFQTSHSSKDRENGQQFLTNTDTRLSSMNDSMNTKTAQNSTIGTQEIQDDDTTQTRYDPKNGITGKSVGSVETSFICPVCGKRLSFDSRDALRQFNGHVDTCLNTQVITDLLKQDSVKNVQGNNEQQTSKKRKRDSPNPKTKRRTIEHFLTK